MVALRKRTSKGQVRSPCLSAFVSLLLIWSPHNEAQNSHTQQKTKVQRGLEDVASKEFAGEAPVFDEQYQGMYSS